MAYGLTPAVQFREAFATLDAAVPPHPRPLDFPRLGVFCKRGHAAHGLCVGRPSLGVVLSGPIRVAARARSPSRRTRRPPSTRAAVGLSAHPGRPLRGALLSQVFHESIIAVSDQLTRCTLALYTDIVQDLPPTPSKFHYIFNLRDLSRVFHGLVLTNPER